MNIRDALEAEHSKAQTMRIAGHIGGSRKRFSELMAIVTGDDRLLAQRAAWVVSYCAEAHPEMVKPYVGELLAHLRKPDLHDAIKRNTMRTIALLGVDEESAGLATDIAFDLLNTPGEAVAVKAHAMGVLEQLCRREPELAAELRLSIEHQLPHEKKPAFRVRAREVLKSLDRIDLERE